MWLARVNPARSSKESHVLKNWTNDTVLIRSFHNLVDYFSFIFGEMRRDAYCLLLSFVCVCVCVGVYVRMSVTFRVSVYFHRWWIARRRFAIDPAFKQIATKRKIKDSNRDRLGSSNVVIFKTSTGSGSLAFEWCIYIWSWPILKVKIKVMQILTVNIS